VRVVQSVRDMALNQFTIVSCFACQCTVVEPLFSDCIPIEHLNSLVVVPARSLTCIFITIIVKSAHYLGPYYEEAKRVRLPRFS
jgi:hypothetical protein